MTIDWRHCCLSWPPPLSIFLCSSKDTTSTQNKPSIKDGFWLRSKTTLLPYRALCVHPCKTISAITSSTQCPILSLYWSPDKRITPSFSPCLHLQNTQCLVPTTNRQSKSPYQLLEEISKVCWYLHFLKAFPGFCWVFCQVMFNHNYRKRLARKNGVVLRLNWSAGLTFIVQHQEGRWEAERL